MSHDRVGLDNGPREFLPYQLDGRVLAYCGGDGA